MTLGRSFVCSGTPIVHRMVDRDSAAAIMAECVREEYTRQLLSACSERACAYLRRYLP